MVGMTVPGFDVDVEVDAAVVLVPQKARRSAPARSAPREIEVFIFLVAF